jgi:hypothetical protein
MKRRTFLGAVGGVTILGGGYLGWELFAPERATAVDEDRVASASVGGSTDGTTGSNANDGSGDDGEAPATETSDMGEDGGATVLKRGEFTGKGSYRCSGTVELAEDAQGRFLQFRDFEMTPGPDVFCYLTPDADPDRRAQIAAGTRIRIDGGADGGELTKTGTFSQSLPDGVDGDDANGVSAWCDDFSVPFGAATLETL